MFADDVPSFSVNLRGYDRVVVDDYVARVLKIRAGSRERLPPPRFVIVLRGYNRAEVDAYLREQAAVCPGQIPAPE